MQACATAFAATEAELKKCAADIESGSCVVDFGAKSDALCGAAAQSFVGKAPAAKDAGEQKLLAAKVRICHKNGKHSLLSKPLANAVDCCTGI